MERVEVSNWEVATVLLAANNNFAILIVAAVSVMIIAVVSATLVAGILILARRSYRVRKTGEKSSFEASSDVETDDTEVRRVNVDTK